MGLNVKGLIELKIAYRNLIKKPIRTLFTLIAIILGVSIFFSVNVSVLQFNSRTHMLRKC